MESIKKDKDKRNLGQKSYKDNNLFFETLFSSTEQEFTSTSFQVVDNLEFTKFFDSETAILLIASFQLWISGSGPGASEVSIMIDNISVKNITTRFGEPKTSTLSHIGILDSNNHTFSLKCRLTDDFGSQIVHIDNVRFSYIQLAKK